jgi:site-specific DNA-methyltransferase (adenine-specific)
MIHIPDESINLMVTSPPYNTIKVYDENLTLLEYMDLIMKALKEVFRVLKDGGIAALNIANVGRKPYLPLNCFIINIFEEVGFHVFQEIIWNKSASAGGSCAWGSWQSASNPSLRDVHEYIILAVKSSSKCRIKFPREELNINLLPEKLGNKKFNVEKKELIGNLWAFSTESAKRVNHPAPFPIELPYRLIILFTEKNDIILDPFMGSGTVAIASILSGRRFVGYETSAEYQEIAKERIKRYLNDVS